MPSYERHKTAYPGVYYIELNNPKKERSFYIVYRLPGEKRKHEEKAGRQFLNDMTPARAAQIRAAKITGKRKSNAERRADEEAPNTIDALFLEYMAAHSSMKRPDGPRSLYHRHIQPFIGDKKPENLTLRDFDRLRHEKQRDLSPQTVRHVLSLAVRIVNFGADRGLCAPLPFRVEMPRFDNRVTEDLTGAEVRKMLDAADDYGDPQVSAIMRLALYTGMRKGEMLRLTWSDIDFRRGFITIRGAKGVVTSTIPINKHAREVIKSLPRSGDYLFPGRHGEQRHVSAFKRQLKAIRDAAGLPKSFRPLHGLRHVFATRLASSGKVDMYTLQKLLTHKSPMMTQRYAHLRDEALRRAADVADDIFEDES